jgi:site-specific recombinase XerD
MVESGANIVAISKILGHSDLKTTMMHTHPEDTVRDALENLANFSKTTTNIATSDSIVN